MPVLDVRRAPDCITGPNREHAAVPALREPTPCGYHQILAEWMQMPGRARAGLERDEGRRYPRGFHCLKQWFEAHAAAEPICGSDARDLRAVRFDDELFHGGRVVTWVRAVCAQCRAWRDTREVLRLFKRRRAPLCSSAGGGGTKPQRHVTTLAIDWVCNGRGENVHLWHRSHIVSGDNARDRHTRLTQHALDVCGLVCGCPYVESRWHLINVVRRARQR